MITKFDGVITNGNMSYEGGRIEKYSSRHSRFIHYVQDNFYIKILMASELLCIFAID